MSPSRCVYTLLAYALLPYALLHLLVRSRKQPAYLKHIGERFGFYSETPAKPVIWLHAVSVGETRAAQPLVKALRRTYPEHQILLTHMTPTGRETSERLFGDSILRCYLPYDFPQAVKRFLAHFKPVAGALMETEIWFNLIHLCKQANIPLYLVNARLSEKSAASYSRFRSLVSAGLNELTAIAAQTEGDAERLRSLGANAVQVTGNLKFDMVPPFFALELGRELRSSFGARPVFLAASTRAGEEEVVLQAVSSAGVPGLLSVIVPRHPQRFDEVAALLERRGIKFQRRSEESAVAADTRVVLGDSMGEMFAYYAACDVAFVGGSLLPLGGQNLLEACAMGKPVLIGPHTFNFAEAAELAVQAGAAQRVADAAGLGDTLKSLFADEAKRKAMGEAGREFCAKHQGATQKILNLIRVR
ncbi:MAG TPA: lipid IV(A) 3-deoxy-D-manno-octulosonic acid transferase [Burkholderiales bacterium]|nr:lipid IV(A) 3-deoxy-D-manno-octulosonic acid transferase [Burkholderiales bacterium]